MTGEHAKHLPGGELLFTAKYRGHSISVGHATAAELIEIAEQPTSKVIDKIGRWGIIGVRPSPGARRTTLHAVGWQQRGACPWVTSPLREVALGPLTVGTVSGQAYRLVGKPEQPLGQDLMAAVAEAMTAWGLEDVEAVVPG